MLKRTIPVFAVLIAILLILFSVRNHLLKFGLLRYLRGEFDGACEIERTALSLGDVAVNNLSCRDAAGDISLGQIKVKLQFVRPFAPTISELYLKDVSITLKDLERIVTKIKDISKRISNKKVSSDEKSEFKVFVDLDNIDIESTDVKKLDLKTNLSFKVVLGADGIIKIEDMIISECKVRAGVVKIKNLNLAKDTGDGYVLSVPYLKIKDGVIEELNVPLVIDNNKIIIKRTENVFFGQTGYIEGELDLSRYQNSCLGLDLGDFSFRPMIKVFRPDEDIVLGGVFGGKVKFCFGADTRDINASLYNKAGGTLDIKKEADLSFLKRYLDKSSYQAVIDNFKNYKYNEGKILIKKTENTVETTLYFDSETMGKRDITINFHNIFGGEQ